MKDFWGGDDEVGTEAICYSKAFLKGERFDFNDVVIVNLDSRNIMGGSYRSKGVCKVKSFFLHEYMGNIELFFKGEYFNTGQCMEYFPIERVTGMAIINSMQLNNLRWRIMPANQILHKCFLLPFGDNGDRVIYEMKDSNIRSRLLEPGYPGCVQPWLERGDIVLVMFEMTSTSCRKAIVRGVNKQQKKVKLGFLIQDT